MTTDTSEHGFETLICKELTGVDRDTDVGGANSIGERSAAFGVGWILGDAQDYNREYCIDLEQLRAFLSETQPDVAATLDLGLDNNTRRQFLARLQGEVNKRGTISVLRNGIRHGPNDVVLMYGQPSEQNLTATEQYSHNRFSVTRQLRYSKDNTRLALDLCLFINGMPVATFELKNSLTKQTVDDAVEQYKHDRDPQEPLFAIGRCLVHFALDEHEIQFCTELKSKASWFLPFNKGWDDGAGNPPNPNGLKTDYLWRDVLTTDGLVEIIENYAQVVETTDDKTRRKRREQIWPRYHQLDVVRKLLADVRSKGIGQRYLIQHSAGSGKSNSIAWLAHQLIGLERGGESILDSVIVVTDRRVLDHQINATIRQFAQVGSIVGHADKSGDLRQFLSEGKKIVITTVQKFPFVLNEIGDERRGRRFGIIIDEAHSSQGGKTSASMSEVLGKRVDDEEEDQTLEDEINRIMESKQMLPNASYFAFTATPKNRTLEIFGAPVEQPGGIVRHVPFHSYTMKQAIQEGFIIDVLQHYTPFESFYKLVKTVEDDPEFDVRKASTKLRRYVENHEYAIEQKSEIMVDHFFDQVLQHQKVGGQARAMVVTSSIARAVRYYHAIRDYLTKRKSPYKAIVAFSGKHEYAGQEVTEASLNGFPSNQIASKIQEDPYRILVCADKFQTGYDEPLLHTMYVDKPLSGVKAVQTLSRLNRSHPKKHDAFVLDFSNDVDVIAEGFSDYYRTTILSEETDPNRLHDLMNDLDNYQVYNWEQIDEFVGLYLKGADRQRLDPILDICVERYRRDLDEDGQVGFKGRAKAFLRTYGFLVAVLTYPYPKWEKLSIFLNFLVSKLPAPIEEDLSKGVLDAIDMESYRVEKQAVEKILLSDDDGELDPSPEGGGYKTDPEIDRLSIIIQQFNDTFGNIEWGDTDRVFRMITEDLPRKVSEDTAYQNAMKNSDRDNARIEHDNALLTTMTELINDDTELYKQFMDNQSFRAWVQEMNFAATYKWQDAA